MPIRHAPELDERRAKRILDALETYQSIAFAARRLHMAQGTLLATLDQLLAKLGPHTFAALTSEKSLLLLRNRDHLSSAARKESVRATRAR